jgi:broad specificity phosphatase PhoE
MKIYLVRHGNKGDVKDPHLTKKGMKQAKLLAKRLKKIHFDKFYCSDLNRAKETSKIVSKKIKIKPVIEGSLNEYEAKEIKVSLSGWKKERAERLKKLYKFLDKLTKDSEKDKTVLIIAHGITNRIILSYLMKIDLKKMVPFMQTETGINKFKYSKKFKNWRLMYWNDSEHLPIKLK